MSGRGNLQTSWATRLQGGDCAVGWNFGINNANDGRYSQQITSTILGSSTVRHYTCLARAVCLFVCLFVRSFLARQTPVGQGLLIHEVNHTQRRTTVSRTPPDKLPARRRDPYLKSHNNHNRQTSMPPTGFEPTVSAGERTQTCALARATKGTVVAKEVQSLQY